MEPFTDEKVINQILDLININIDTTFFEPTCGTGNFLVQILKKKFNLIENNDITKSLLAISSLYGVDIIEDCVQTTKERLYQLFTNKVSDIPARERCKKILNSNIIQTDILKFNSKIHYNIIIGNPPYWINNNPIYKDIINHLLSLSYDELLMIIPKENKKQLLWIKDIQYE